MIKPYLQDRLHETLFGTHVSMTDSIASEILGAAGFDFVWIDTEHSENNTTSVRQHLNAIQGQGTAAIVRVTKNDQNHLKHILELGVDGIVFPMINSAEEAMAAVQGCLYPPLGVRGCGPLRATRYGQDSMSEYIDSESLKICKFVQIETVEAVNNLPEIIKVPHIDGFFFGIMDLSGSVGKLSQIYCDEVQNLVKKSISELKKAGKPIGISINCTDPIENRKWYEMGINIISSGSDFDYIFKGATENIKGLKAAIQR